MVTGSRAVYPRVRDRTPQGVGYKSIRSTKTVHLTSLFHLIERKNSNHFYERVSLYILEVKGRSEFKC